MPSESSDPNPPNSMPGQSPGDRLRCRPIANNLSPIAGRYPRRVTPNEERTREAMVEHSASNFRNVDATVTRPLPLKTIWIVYAAHCFLIHRIKEFEQAIASGRANAPQRHATCSEDDTPEEWRKHVFGNA